KISSTANGGNKWNSSRFAERTSQLTQAQFQTSNAREAPRDRNSNREFSLYIKVSNKQIDYRALFSAFSHFGPVKNLDVVPAKSCAFVEFHSQDVYQRVLQQREISVPGFEDETVVVEERRQDRHRDRPRYDDYQRNHGQSLHRNHGQSLHRNHGHSLYRNHGQSLHNTYNRMNLQGGGGSPNYRTEKKSRLTLYVKVGNEQMNHDVLWNAFSYFGPVKNLDVVPVKSCAFVEFYSQDAYQQALQQRHISVPGFGNETVIVEERRERRKDDNSRYRNQQRRW
ncbi:1005_t:CDS:2, partial [Cetraspora pellucida]